MLFPSSTLWIKLMYRVKNIRSQINHTFSNINFVFIKSLVNSIYTFHKAYYQLHIVIDFSLKSGDLIIVFINSINLDNEAGRTRINFKVMNNYSL